MTKSHLLQGSDTPTGTKVRRRILATCIAALLATEVAPAHTSDMSPAAEPPRGNTLIVTNCDDNGPGSLRATLASATEGDAIDLTELECSTITLTSGELATALDDIRLTGNGQTISAGGDSRVIAHTGSGTFTASGLIFADGVVSGVAQAQGGCLYSSGSLALSSVTVQDCLAASVPDIDYSLALGGGVFSRNETHLTESTVTNNEVIPALGYYSYAFGGGVFTWGPLTVTRSTISGNSVLGNGSGLYGYQEGGGIYARSSAEIRDSTITGNSAFITGGVVLRGNNENGVSTIANSTISGNMGVFRVGGVSSNEHVLNIWNSTIAFNTVSLLPGPLVDGAGVLILGHNQELNLRSSIIANNTSSGISDDLCLNDFSHQTLVGSDNLIQVSNIDLPDTIHTDPMLAPLADNGGGTLMHALLPGSPAINAGNNLAGLTYDQRGDGFDRVIGPSADIGAYEEQQPPPDGIFANGFE